MMVCPHPSPARSPLPHSAPGSPTHARADFPLADKYAKYEAAYGETSELLPELNAKLLELDAMIHSAESCTEGIGVSYDDIDLWARLRSLTVIKGVEYPPKLRAYLDHFEATGDVPLYDVMAV